MILLAVGAAAQAWIHWNRSDPARISFEVEQPFPLQVLDHNGEEVRVADRTVYVWAASCPACRAQATSRPIASWSHDSVAVILLGTDQQIRDFLSETALPPSFYLHPGKSLGPRIPLRRVEIAVAMTPARIQVDRQGLIEVITYGWNGQGTTWTEDF
ncbi:MAG: hypothetical protein RJQ04_14785 [Longimicrobiales bacterium]